MPTPKVKNIKVPEDAPKRLDVFLVDVLEISRAKVQEFIHAGQVTLNEKLPKKPGDQIKAGDKVVVDQTPIVREKPQTEEEAAMQEEPRILRETKDYVVLHKPAGLLVHPTKKQEKQTLVAWLLNKYPTLKNVGENKDRPGIVHRLDKDASGVMVIAKTQKMFKHLKEQFQNRGVEKYYTVLVHEEVERDHSVIDFAIDRGPDGRMVARPKTEKEAVRTALLMQPGKEALTEFWVQKRFVRFTLLKVRIHTGRTHQIRVHFYAYNNPLVGDVLYHNVKLNRKRDKELGRLFLHATELIFKDLTGEVVDVVDELPQELSNFLDELV
jgi:23S rRNA pseudouridine1911/1915/1917 synthase